MSNNEYLKSFGKLYEKVIALRNDDDFLINEPQMVKFFEVYEFFTKAAGETETAKVEPIKLAPREEHGGITATFVVFDMYGEILEGFKKIVQHLSAMTIDVVRGEEICISVTVPNVFIPKAKG